MATSIKICNVVASVDFGQRIPLRNVGKAFSIPLTRRNRFPGLVVRLQKPKTVNLIFSTGKMICTGSSSEQGVRRAVKKVVDKLENRGVKLRGKPQVKIQNVVALLDFGKKINLEKAAKSLTKTIYEPEQFPGLIYQLDQPKTVALLFSNGKAVLTGARSKREVEEAVRKLEKALFRKGRRRRVKASGRGEPPVSSLQRALEILEATYSLCEFCGSSCEVCPYPNLGVYVEKASEETLKYTSLLASPEKCRKGFYVKPKREISLLLRNSAEDLRDLLVRLLSEQVNLEALQLA
ncbi:hypothetical protein DRO53_02670 [Candidatus Bathyarchaeota archaeon]|nr:MAG: hypothetical protein DRO46_00325 [Candidatus Hecatellales archaeon]RLI34838.1 MAG: hypothetical protein DRO53_02670 [Candidatus Bathyarchaeota archaeon]